MRGTTLQVYLCRCGDGKKLVRDALAGRGTAGNPLIALPRPGSTPAAAAPPPPPTITRTAERENPDARTGAAPAGHADRATSAAPAPARGGDQPPVPVMNAVEARQTPTAARAPGAPSQLLPKGDPDLIAVPSEDPTLWPSIVEALTRAPGVRATDATQHALPDLAATEVPAAPETQEAIASIIASPHQPDTTASSPSAPDVTDAPIIVEAMTRPPGVADSDRAPQALADLVSAATPGTPELQDALSPILIPQPTPDLALPVNDGATVAQALDSSTMASALPSPDPPNQLTLEPTPPPATMILVPKTPIGSAASATGGHPGPPVPPADPAADTGLESDPFSKIPGVEFRNGKVEARSGRQVKPVRPRLTEAARHDLLALEFPTILLKVRIDPNGKVEDVKVLRGSGSEAVDMPVYRAMWQWWFEPPKDPQGKPRPDVQLVAIHWG